MVFALTLLGMAIPHKLLPFSSEFNSYVFYNYSNHPTDWTVLVAWGMASNPLTSFHLIFLGTIFSRLARYVLNKYEKGISGFVLALISHLWLQHELCNSSICYIMLFCFYKQSVSDFFHSILITGEIVPSDPIAKGEAGWYQWCR